MCIRDRSHALGIHRVLVTDRGSASRSITVIDSALDKVSSQRAKLGAYQNRLEHTINNLTTASQNLTAAESRDVYKRQLWNSCKATTSKCRLIKRGVIATKIKVDL